MQAVHLLPLTGQLAFPTAYTPFKPVLVQAHATLLSYDTASWRQQAISLANNRSHVHRPAAATGPGHTSASAISSRLSIGRAQLPSGNIQPTPLQQHSSRHSGRKVQLVYSWKLPQHAGAAITADPATAKPVGSGLPLLLGLRQLPGGAQGLVGYVVLLSAIHRAVIGTVAEVEHIQAHPRAPVYRLLRVHKATVLKPYGFEGQECHVVPLVPDIVTAVYPRQKLLLITPPPGLLDLGRHELLLSFLSHELKQYAPAVPLSPHLHAKLPEGGQPLTETRLMPSRQQLLDAARPDLVKIIIKLGGFAQTALRLGYRSCRRPKGYWDSLELLDAELQEFIAGSWVALPVAEGGELAESVMTAAAAGEEEDQDALEDAKALHQQHTKQRLLYYYNMATRSIKWGLPATAKAHLTGQRDNSAAGGSSNWRGLPVTAAVEPGSKAAAAAASRPSSSRVVRQALLGLNDDDRVMPAQSSLKSAGRYDLHHAVVRHGGYRQVAGLLGRRLSWPVPLGPLQTPEGLLQAVTEVTQEHGWDDGVLPSMRQLRDAGRDQLIKAISYHGGWRATAQLLGLASALPAGDPAAATPAGLAQQLLDFMIHTPPPHDSTAARSRNSSSNRQQQRGGTTGVHSQQAKQQQRQQHHQWSRLPTQRELVAAGRSDLMHWLQRHGHEPIRLLLGLPQTRKQLKKGILVWGDVESAVRAGCHTAAEILQHITAAASGQQSHYQQKQQHAASGLANSSEPLVSREHLVRQLKVWCDQGKLVKVRRGHYQLDVSCAGRIS